VHGNPGIADYHIKIELDSKIIFSSLIFFSLITN
jgi:hypothetical protein